MSDIAEITITKVSNGWTVKWIGDGGTDEAVARDVDELCEVLCDVLEEEKPDSKVLFRGPSPDGDGEIVVSSGKHPTTPPAPRMKSDGYEECDVCGLLVRNAEVCRRGSECQHYRRATMKPAVKTEGPISVGEEFKCSCGDGGEWPRVDYCASEGCPFESAPWTQTQ